MRITSRWTVLAASLLAVQVVVPDGASPGTGPARRDEVRCPLKWMGHVGSGFGYRRHPLLHACRFHTGWDLPQPAGTPVFASRDGQVVFSGWRSGYGQLVRLKHADGRETLYGHLSVRLVREGDWTAAGDTLVGRVGATGLATGPHLHFEVRDARGRPLDPRSWLSQAGWRAP